MGYSRKNTDPPDEWQTGNSRVRGEDSSGNPAGRRDLNRKILPRGSLLTVTSIVIFHLFTLK